MFQLYCFEMWERIGEEFNKQATILILNNIISYVEIFEQNVLV